MKTTYTHTELANLEDSLKHEYLLTNGLGGYCSSTILDCHKRKYNGLLVVPLPGLEKRYNLLSKLDCSVTIKDNEYHLATNKFPNVFAPTGHQYLESFEWDGYPVTTYRIGDTIIKKSILMPQKQNTVLICWEVVAAKYPVMLKADPFFAYRDVDSLMTKNMDIRPRTYFEQNGFKFEPYEGLPAVYMQTSRRSKFYPAPNWWTEFEYLKERNRGYGYKEDLFTPGAFEMRLKAGEKIIFRAGLVPAKAQIHREWDKELARQVALKEQFADTPEPLQTLKISAQQYVIQPRARQADIVAGYPWFGCWGRDTMIALAGLTLCTDNAKTALVVLRSYAAYQRDGLLPNMVGATGDHAYNSVDAPLLYFRAVQQYLSYTNDKKVCGGIVGKALIASITALLDNTVPGVRLDNGFLYAGNVHTNLTWMDANVHGVPVTPRHGAAIEINALWYNALQFLMNDFTGKIPARLQKRLAHEAKLFEEKFMDAFDCQENACFCDVYRGAYDRDTDIRPNQLFALSLPYTCVPAEKAKVYLETIKRHLVTPYGLRTLSPQNPAYCSVYTGSPESRDAAYHQGMVWPWLVGIFGDAVLAFADDKNEAKKYLLNMFEPFFADHLEIMGIGHISEIITPNAPYVPKGCFAQGWSVAEVLRLFDTLQKIEA